MSQTYWDCIYTQTYNSLCVFLYQIGILLFYICVNFVFLKYCFDFLQYLFCLGMTNFVNN